MESWHVQLLISSTSNFRFLSLSMARCSWTKASRLPDVWSSVKSSPHCSGGSSLNLRSAFMSLAPIISCSNNMLMILIRLAEFIFLTIFVWSFLNLIFNTSFDSTTVLILQTKLSPFTVHCLRWRMPPFMRQCWGLPHRLAQCMSPQGWGKLVNAALLSLMRRVWFYAALPCSRVNSSAQLVCRHDRVTRRGRACRPNGEGIGGGGILSDVVPSSSLFQSCGCTTE